jgi:hypothetical protein
MQIDSTRLHEALNQLAIQAHECSIRTAVEAIKAVRRAICDIEADTACENARVKYPGCLAGCGGDND